MLPLFSRMPLLDTEIMGVTLLSYKKVTTMTRLKECNKKGQEKEDPFARILHSTRFLEVRELLPVITSLSSTRPLTWWGSRLQKYGNENSVQDLARKGGKGSVKQRRSGLNGNAYNESNMEHIYVHFCLWISHAEATLYCQDIISWLQMTDFMRFPSLLHYTHDIRVEEQSVMSRDIMTVFSSTDYLSSRVTKRVYSFSW